MFSQPSETSSPEHVLKYLARYLTGGPISDKRLLEESNGKVAFLARAGDGSDKQIRVERTGVEFVRLWSLHILPKGFTKSRFFGGWSNNQRASFLNRCGKRCQAKNRSGVIKQQTRGSCHKGNRSARLTSCSGE